MAALQYIAPQFLEEGRMGWLRSPLYIVKKEKSEDYYYSDEEMDAARSKISGEVQRNKGLGSLSPEQAHNSMFVEGNQRLELFSPDDNSIQLLCELMGVDVKPRTEFIFNYVDFSKISE